MNQATRIEKLKTLQEVLQGKNKTLQKYYRQHRKRTMPFLEVHGFVNIRSCSPQLLDLLVIPTESIIDGKRNDYITLKDYLRRFDETPSKQCSSHSAIGNIDIDSNNYDSVTLDCIQIRYSGYSNRYLQSNTIGDLRRYFKQSASAFDEYPFLLLSFETDLSRFDWYFNKDNPK